MGVLVYAILFLFFFFRYRIDISSIDYMTRRGSEMRTRFLRGDSAQNNGLTLPAGEFSYDTEKKALRLHDGQTLGGFEIIGTRAISLGPGPDTLVGGDPTLGYFGTVPSTEMFTPSELTSLTGVSQGILGDTTDWIKFYTDGKILFSPMKPTMAEVSWETLYHAGVILGVDAADDGNPMPTVTPTNQWTELTLGEHRFSLRVHYDLYEFTNIRDQLISGYPGNTLNWASFSPDQFGTLSYDLNWLANRRGNNVEAAGYVAYGSTDFGYNTQNITTTRVSTGSGNRAMTWTPVLELIR